MNIVPAATNGNAPHIRRMADCVKSRIQQLQFIQTKSGVNYFEAQQERLKRENLNRQNQKDGNR